MTAPLSALEGLAHRAPHAAALIDIDGGRVSYLDLVSRIVALSSGLLEARVERGDRIAIVTPNGVGAAVAFLGSCAVGIAAPLNPALPADELTRSLADLDARAVVSATDHLGEAGSAAARLAAQRLGLPVVKIGSDGVPVGVASTDAIELGPRVGDLDDVALVLPTSGTTARPKLVPLTHRNLAHSAFNVRLTLDLTPADRCLNVMPLFHIHGLVAALLGSLTSGASVVCAPGFDAARFAGWLDRLAPTWYTAVPTIHQAVLHSIPTAGAASVRHRLRFIRSSSSALPPSVMADLERAFQVPVIEAYGMSEAAHQITSNPLPPGQRKGGSVGVPRGVEVRILGKPGGREEASEPAEVGASAGRRGEVGIRGPNVTRGYWGDPEVNAASFVDGWLRTGDEGYFDADGYLFLTGRIKELINRGGEKISPRDIEDVVLGHPAVGEVAAFAVPHPDLGEEVGIAVVAAPGATCTEESIREFVRERLAYFKIPRYVRIVDEIPKGPTGKIQRTALAGQLGLPADPTRSAASRSRPPRTDLEAQLCGLVGELLGGPPVGVVDDFIAIGCDSLLGTRLLAQVRARHGVELTLAELFRLGTVERLAVGVTQRQVDAYASGDLDQILAELSASPEVSGEHRVEPSTHNGEGTRADGRSG